MQPDKHFQSNKIDIYVKNSTPWITTTNQATKFLSHHVKENETFLSLPYAPLFYFMTDKSSPTRQLLFLKFLDISIDQQNKIIDDMENNNTNWIILSKRKESDEPGLGNFGEDHCQILNAYIKDNFEEHTTIGIWEDPRRWFSYPGYKILKRKNI